MSFNILIAEDDAFLADTIEVELSERGAAVRSAKNGEEAIAHIEEQLPDLLLLDLLMPRKDGYAVLSHVREKYYRFPIIILSNLSDEIDREKCLTLGAKDYVVKCDIDAEELWGKVEPYLIKQS